MGNKTENIIVLEGLQKTANERYITAQILSQSLDNVYRLFEINAEIEITYTDSIFTGRYHNKYDIISLDLLLLLTALSKSEVNVGCPQ